MNTRPQSALSASLLGLAGLAFVALSACGGSGGEGGTDCAVGEFCACTTSADCPDPAVEECSAIGICVAITGGDVGNDTTDTDAGADTDEEVTDDAGGDTVDDTDATIDDTVDDTDTTVDDTTDTTVDDTTDTTIDDTTDTTVEDTADTIEDTVDPVINPWIAFVSQNPDTSRDFIELIRADGTGRIALTAASTMDRAENLLTAPAWSPDGTQLAYLGRAVGATNADIRVIDFESGLQRTLATGLTLLSDVAFSPDGTQLVFTADTDLVGVPLRSLYRINNANGATPTLILTSPGGDASPQWADATTIWYTSAEATSDPRDIYSINPAGTGREAFTSFGSATIFGGISLSIDQSMFAFGGDSGIVLFEIDTEDDTTIAVDGDAEPDFFPDGERLVINRQFPGRIDLVVIDMNGDDVLRLTDDAIVNGQPDVSPIDSADIDITNF
jgi:Tol biopolymer transport system component